MKQKTDVKRLSRIQKLAYQGIVGTMGTTPTASLEIFLILPPLHLVMGEVRMTQFRQNNRAIRVRVNQKCGRTNIKHVQTLK